MKCMNCGTEVLEKPRILCPKCYQGRLKPSLVKYNGKSVYVVANNTHYSHEFDLEDEPLLEGLAWYETRTGQLWTRISKKVSINADYLVCGMNGAKIYKHRDGNKYDHRKANLRPAGARWRKRMEETTRMSVAGATPYHGVHALHDGYVARLMGNEASEWVPTAEEAARIYDREQMILHGPAAITNVELGLIAGGEAYEYTKKFRLVVDEVLRLARGPKTEAYGETWKNTGLLGIYIKIMIKEGRLHQLVWKDRNFNGTGGESLRDTLLDIAAYAMYGVITFDEQNWEGSAESRIKLLLKEVGEEL